MAFLRKINPWNASIRQAARAQANPLWSDLALLATELPPGQRDNPRAMPLDDYVKESMALFAANGEGPERLVEQVKMQRRAEVRGDHDKLFALVSSG